MKLYSECDLKEVGSWSFWRAIETPHRGCTAHHSQGGGWPSPEHGAILRQFPSLLDSNICNNTTQKVMTPEDIGGKGTGFTSRAVCRWRVGVWARSSPTHPKTNQVSSSQCSAALQPLFIITINYQHFFLTSWGRSDRAMCLAVAGQS